MTGLIHGAGLVDWLRRGLTIATRNDRDFQATGVSVVNPLARRSGGR